MPGQLRCHLNPPMNDSRMPWTTSWGPVKDDAAQLLRRVYARDAKFAPARQALDGVLKSCLGSS